MPTELEHNETLDAANLLGDAEERHDEGAPTIPLMSGLGDDGLGTGEDAPPRGAAARINRMSSLILLVVVIGVSGSVLLGMRKLGLGGRLEVLDFKIDYPLEAAEKAVNDDDHENVIEDLRNSVEVQQVPPELVQMNPFEWKAASKVVDRDDRADLEAQEAARLRREREEWRRRMDTAFRTLVLNSVKGGRVPMANISGRLVRIGDRVDEYFSVEAINGRVVELRDDDGRLHRLTIGE